MKHCDYRKAESRPHFAVGFFARRGERRLAGKRADSMAGAHRPRGFYREAGCGRVAVLTARELCAIIAVRAAVGVRAFAVLVA